MTSKLLIENLIVHNEHVFNFPGESGGKAQKTKTGLSNACKLELVWANNDFYKNKYIISKIEKNCLRAN